MTTTKKQIAVRGADRTSWPAELKHTEMCAWRFGMNAKCDCGKELKSNG
jgi:hypothetical protein